MIELPYLWLKTTANKYCGLESLENVPAAHEIQFGKPRLTNFPKDAHYKMSKEFKKQIALADNLWGPGGDRVISAKLRAFVEARVPMGVEFLPVSIINHKGKLASSEYFILHPVLIIDCVDQESSKFTWNPINREAIGTCSQLVFNLGQIPDNALVWRPRHLEQDVFVQRRLADDIVAGGFTGVYFDELENYGG